MQQVAPLTPLGPCPPTWGSRLFSLPAVLTAARGAVPTDVVDVARPRRRLDARASTSCTGASAIAHVVDRLDLAGDGLADEDDPRRLGAVEVAVVAQGSRSSSV